MNNTRNIDELCKITGYDRKHVKRVLDMGVEIGAFKKISDNDYEMTDMGLKVASKITKGNYKSVDTGTWTCSKCKIVNNALNGKNCIKCNYSYVDSIASDTLNKEQKKFKFPQVTDREMLIFLIGHITGMAGGIPIPNTVSFKQKMEYTHKVSLVLTELTSKVADQFSHISTDELSEILSQINALRTIPFLEEAMKKMRDVKL